MNSTFSLGNTLATGFRVWGRNFVPFTLLALMMYAPLILWGVSAAGGDPTRSGYIEGLKHWEQASVYLVMPLGILVSASVTYGCVMTMQGQGATLGACISVGLRRFFPAVATLIFLVLCFGGLALVVGFPAGMIFGAFGKGGVLVASGIVLVMILWLYSLLFVSMQACVIERPGPLAALGRSRDLTHGHRLSIAILCILQFAINFGLQKLIESATLTSGSFKTYIYASIIRDVLVGSFGAVMGAVAYSLLRNEKDGTTVDELAQVFG